jgi:hypothetical protein
MRSEHVGVRCASIVPRSSQHKHTLRLRSPSPRSRARTPNRKPKLPGIGRPVARDSVNGLGASGIYGDASVREPTDEAIRSSRHVSDGVTHEAKNETEGAWRSFWCVGLEPVRASVRPTHS